MRLIDADALLKQYNPIVFTAQTAFAEGMREVIDDIKNEQTIDAVPVVHGHWVRSDFFSDPIQTVEECSLCGELIGRFSKQLNYCPYCGAKMDEEAKEAANAIEQLVNERDAAINGPNRHDAIEAWNKRADDAGPVRHAKNVMEDYPSLFQCSACGWSCDDTYCGDSAYRYYPGCGAKIDGEADV